MEENERFRPKRAINMKLRHNVSSFELEEEGDEIIQNQEN
jgi:hypothetical protein